MADVFTRSKSAPAIHNKNKVIDRDEDDDLHASNGNVGRNGGGVNGTAKSNGAASASNGNYDSEDSDNEGPKDGDIKSHGSRKGQRMADIKSVALGKA